MNGLRKTACLALSVAVLVGSLGVRLNDAHAAPAPTQVVVKSGPFRGTVTNPKGRPVSGVTVKLFGKDGSLAASTVTDTDGKYTFPNLLPGRYDLVVGGRVSVKLLVTDGVGVRQLTVVLPHSGRAALGGLLKTRIVIIGSAGVGVATAIAVPLVLTQRNRGRSGGDKGRRGPRPRLSP